MTSTLVGDGNCPSSSGRLSGVWLDQVTYQPHTWPLILIHSPLTPFHSFLTSSFLQGATLVVALYVETNPLFSPVINIFHLCPSSDLVFIYTVSLKNLLLPSTSLPYLEICLLHHTISLQTSPHYIRGDSPIEANYNFLTQQACLATNHKKTDKHTLKAFTMAYISEVPLTPPHFPKGNTRDQLTRPFSWNRRSYPYSALRKTRVYPKTS